MGRLDETIHPFATRITPKDNHKLRRGIYFLGHGLYDMNLPEDMWGEHNRKERGVLEEVLPGSPKAL
jgi:Zn-dependent M32 family carboxypeptidase